MEDIPIVHVVQGDRGNWTKANPSKHEEKYTNSLQSGNLIRFDVRVLTTISHRADVLCSSISTSNYRVLDVAILSERILLPSKSTVIPCRLFITINITEILFCTHNIGHFFFFFFWEICFVWSSNKASVEHQSDYKDASHLTVP